MLGCQTALNLCPSAWNSPLTVSHHTESSFIQPLWRARFSCLRPGALLLPPAIRPWPDPRQRMQEKKAQVSITFPTSQRLLKAGCDVPSSALNYYKIPPPAPGARGAAAAVSMVTVALWGRISVSSVAMAQASITHHCGVLNNKYECWQINETHRILSPEKRLLSSVFLRVGGSPAKLEWRDFWIWQESRWQILVKCKLPQFHWSQQRYDNLHPLRFCHWVISTLQITGNILPNKNTQTWSKNV